MTSEISTVLVTGGAGFIGSHTVDLLLEREISVRVLDNLSSGSLDNLDVDNPRLEFFRGDILERGTVDSAMTGVTHCLHLAAQVSVQSSLEDPVHSANQNLIGFLNVIDSAKSHSVRRFVYASSAAVYGHPESVPVAEGHRVHPLSPYGIEKHTNEVYANLYSEQFGLSCFGQRYFNVYGPRQDPRSPYAGVIALFVDRISKGEPVQVYGDGEQTRDFVFVRDVALANLAAISNDNQGICNIGTGRQTNLNELIDIIASLIKRQSPVEFMPPRNGDIKHSLANVDRMSKILDYSASTSIESGLSILINSLI